MSVRSAESDTHNHATAPNNSDTMQAPGYSARDQRNGIPALFAKMSALGVGQNLGVDIEKYIETLKGVFQKDLIGGVNNISIRRLSQPTGSHAFVWGDSVIILMFDAMLPRDQQNFNPSSDYGAIAYEAFKQEIGANKKLLHVILVQPEDYVRVQQMAEYLLINLAIGNNAAGDVKVNDLNGLQFSVDSNCDIARTFIESHNPHTVQPRIDIGFTIYARQPRTPGQRNLLPEESRAIAAVGAYVEIWNPPANGQYSPTISPKYAATVHITNITSLFPVAGIIPLCLAVAADQFIQQNLWLQPFMSFQKGKPHLGNLSADPQDPQKMWWAKTPDELYTWMQANMFVRPFMALDISEGYARIPALANYGDYSYTNVVYDQIMEFFGNNTPLNRSTPPFNIMTQTFNGQYGDPRSTGRATDSREIDYMKLLAEGSQDPSARLLLEYKMDPTIRARLLSERTGGSFKSLHRTRISILSADLLSTLAGQVKSKISIDGASSQNQTLPMPWVTDMMTQYSLGTFTTSAASSGGIPWTGSVHYG